jgi:hypothetical protein
MLAELPSASDGQPSSLDGTKVGVEKKSDVVTRAPGARRPLIMQIRILVAEAWLARLLHRSRVAVTGSNHDCGVGAPQVGPDEDLTWPLR